MSIGHLFSLSKEAMSNNSRKNITRQTPDAMHQQPNDPQYSKVVLIDNASELKASTNNHVQRNALHRVFLSRIHTSFTIDSVFHHFSNSTY